MQNVGFSFAAKSVHENGKPGRASAPERLRRFIKVSNIPDVRFGARKTMRIQIHKIIVRHASDIIHDDLVRFGGYVRRFSFVMRFVHVVDMVCKDRRVGIPVNKVCEQPVIKRRHHGADGSIDLCLYGLVFIDQRIVLRLCFFQRLKMCVVQPDIRFAVAVFDDIHREIVDQFRVDRADGAALEAVGRDDPGAFGVLPILAEVRDDIGNAHHAALERGRNEPAYVRFIEITRLDHAVEFGKAVERFGTVFAQLDLAVVRGDPAERLQRNVVRKDPVQHAHGMDVVAEMPVGMCAIQFIQNRLARVPERRLADVVTERDRLDQIEVQVQRLADGAGDAGNELHMQRAAADVVVFIKRKHLRFVRVAVIKRTVDDLVAVADERRADHVRLVPVGITTDHPALIKRNLCKGACLSPGEYSFFGFGRQVFIVGHRIA